MFRDGDHVNEYVDDAVHGLLDSEDAAYVHRHAGRCPACAAALSGALARFERMQREGAIEPSQALVDNTVARAVGRARAAQARRRMGWRWVAGALAACIALLASLHVYFLNVRAAALDVRVVAPSRLIADTDMTLRAVVVRQPDARPVKGATVAIDLVDRQQRREVSLASFTTDAHGSGQPQLRLPAWADGSYELRVTARPPNGGAEVSTRSIELRRSWKLMLSSDKPVYQPGQTIHLRGLALRRPDLRPVSGQEAVFRVIDPKGNVIFKTGRTTSTYGITSVDCPLAEEITEGAYLVRCQIGDATSELTVHVSRYVLPKFRAELALDRPYYRPGERMVATVGANYFFGKPVTGQAALQVSDGPRIIHASTQSLGDEGSAVFEIELPEALVGTEKDAGDARLEVVATITDSAGQEQQRQVPGIVTNRPLRIELIPEAGRLIQAVANRIYVLTTYADGTPADARVQIKGLGQDLRTGPLGVAEFELPAGRGATGLSVQAVDADGLEARSTVDLTSDAHPQAFVLRTDRAVYGGGQTVSLAVIATGREPVFVDVLKDGQPLLTRTIEIADGRGELTLDLPPEASGTLQMLAYRLDPDTAVAVRSSRVVYVEPPAGLKLEVVQDRDEYRPGETANLQFSLTSASGEPTPGAISLAAVDEAVFSVLPQAAGMERTFFQLEQELLKPIYAIYPWSPDLDIAGEIDVEQQRLFEQALFARAASEGVGGGNAARAELERIVDEQGVGRRALDVLDRPDAAELVEDLAWDEQSRQLMQAAIDGGDAMRVTSTYPARQQAFARTRYQALERIQAGWLVLAIGAGVMLVFWVVTTYSLPTRLELGLCVALLLLVASLFLPSLNRARETATRVKAASNLRQLGQAMMLDDAERSPADSPAAVRVRQWFPETLLWRPELITDDAGRASLDVNLADSITTWRLSAGAVSGDGRLGSAQTGIRVFQPFFVDLDLPVALRRGDEVSVPVVVYNYLDQPQEVELTLQRPEAPGVWFELEGSAVQRLQLAPQEVRGTSYRIRATKVGRHALQITARGAGEADAVRRAIDVVPDGRLVEQVHSGTLTEPVALDLNLPADAIEGSGKLIVRLYPSSFSQVVEGLDSIFQRPYGCFEQTSSTTYPNVLALDYLRRTGKSAPEVEAKARQYIHLGYQRLVTFEVDGGGFDWFGRPPANVPLTAYGLMEFEDMAAVHEVDPALIERTRQWLLSKRRGDGAWPADTHMLNDGLADSVRRGSDADLATTAYVAWAVFGSGHGGGVEASVTRQYLLSHGPGSFDDPYVLALACNALIGMDPSGADARPCLQRLMELRQASQDGKRVWWTQPQGQRTTFHGAGVAGDIETTAAATLALLRWGQQPATARAALTWLVEQKDSTGTWHSTQATVLALKALLAGTGKPLGGETERQLELRFNDEPTRTIVIPPDQAEVMQQIVLSDSLRPGPNRLELVDASGADTGYLVSFASHRPEAGGAPQDGPLAIDLSYNRTDLQVGETMTARAVVTNRMATAAPMVIVDLPIPPGFAPVTDGWDKLVRGGTIARYQLTPRSVIVYLRALPAGRSLTLEYRLNATMPVRITTPPAEVYEYYDPSKRSTSRSVALQVAANRGG